MGMAQNLKGVHTAGPDPTKKTGGWMCCTEGRLLLWSWRGGMASSIRITARPSKFAIWPKGGWKLQESKTAYSLVQCRDQGNHTKKRGGILGFILRFSIKKGPAMERAGRKPF